MSSMMMRMVQSRWVTILYALIRTLQKILKSLIDLTIYARTLHCSRSYLIIQSNERFEASRQPLCNLERNWKYFAPNSEVYKHSLIKCYEYRKILLINHKNGSHAFHYRSKTNTFLTQSHQIVESQLDLPGIAITSSRSAKILSRIRIYALKNYHNHEHHPSTTSS